MQQQPLYHIQLHLLQLHRKALSEELKNRKPANGAKNNAKWPDDQTLVLVQEWKDRVEDTETSRSVEAWDKIDAAVNKAGPEKMLKQYKDKIRNLKQTYKDAKTNNSKTGSGTKKVHILTFLMKY